MAGATNCHQTGKPISLNRETYCPQTGNPFVLKQGIQVSRSGHGALTTYDLRVSLKERKFTEQGTINIHSLKSTHLTRTHWKTQPNSLTEQGAMRMVALGQTTLSCPPERVPLLGTGKCEWGSGRRPEKTKAVGLGDSTCRFGCAEGILGVLCRRDMGV
eukprot:1161214-Pelagomonas_calceolata.AAC.4